ncbi:DUF6908 domain-containing protein [Pedobacter soli]|uniref:DUF6908 domain-containing protein n=1 Tax=Pedobacter soli TaxID=390242 RepID=A0A1G6WMF5_9SPHI|nr:hypothetical protein [Pedobacter soli]SDD66397.1 hypothetical protein SAMN04488024_10750 [Pedobacter soli]
MRILSPDSTQIFCNLIERMQDKQHLKIENEPFIALSIEKTAQDIALTGYGNASVYSLAHYYTLNGDLMSDPEMTFIVIHKNEALNISDGTIILPRSFQQSDMGIYEESIIFHLPQGMEVSKNMQAEHTEFAEVWLNNIKDQGFLKRV